MSFEMLNEAPEGTVIKVVGVGGAGGNAIQHMITKGVQGVEFIVANTDAQALRHSSTLNKLQLGESGLGAGAKPEVGRAAAEENRERIADMLRDANMVFITAGMGGGTGTGAAPVIAEVAKELGILTVAVVSKPFEYEGPRRMRVAEEGLRQLEQQVDSLIIILNEKLEQILGQQASALAPTVIEINPCSTLPYAAVGSLAAVSIDITPKSRLLKRVLVIPKIVPAATVGSLPKSSISSCQVKRSPPAEP